MNTYLVKYLKPEHGYLPADREVIASNSQEAADILRKLETKAQITAVLLLTDMKGEWK